VANVPQSNWKITIARVSSTDKDFKPGKENIHAGKAEVYGMTYGPFYVVMNCGKRAQSVPVPRIYRGSKNIQTGKTYSKSKMKVKRGER